MIRGRPDDVTAPAIEAAIVGRLLGVKTTPGLGTLDVITAAAGPVDVPVSEHVARRRLGRVHQHGGAVRPPDGINGGVEGLGIGGMILGGDETSLIV